MSVGGRWPRKGGVGASGLALVGCAATFGWTAYGKNRPSTLTATSLPRCSRGECVAVDIDTRSEAIYL